MSSGPDLEQLLSEAKDALARNQWDRVVESTNRLLKSDPKRYDAYILRALALIKQNRVERALADLAVAIRLDPDRPHSYVIRAGVLKRRCLFDQAIADVTIALCLDPHNAAAFSIRAQCRHAIGDHQGAEEDVQEILRIDPTRPVPRLDAASPPEAAPPPTASIEERFWKQRALSDTKHHGDVFADGKPADRSLNARPILGLDDAAEVLADDSRYAPEVMLRPLPRTRTPRRPSRNGSLMAISLFGCVCLLSGYLLSRNDWGREDGPKVAEIERRSSPVPSAEREPDPSSPVVTPALVQVKDSTYLVALPRTGLRERAGWWSNRGELVLGGEQGHPMVHKPLMFEGKHSEHGVYFSARTDFEASISYRLGRRFDTFQTEILIPDMSPEQTDPRTSLVFKLVGDGKTIWRSEPMVHKGEHRPCRVAVTGVEELSLKVECPGPSNWGLAAWVEPRLFSTDPDSNQVGRSDTRIASVDLLRSADPRQAITGNWIRDGDALSVVPGDGRPAVLPLAHTVPSEYDLEVRAERADGGGFMIGLVHRNARFAACLDFAKGKYWLQAFGDQPLQDNESTTFQGPTFSGEGEVIVRCAVRGDEVSISCNERRVIHWRGDYKRFRDQPLALVVIPDERSLFLASWFDRRITGCRLTSATSTAQGDR